MNNNSFPVLYTIKEAAEILGITPRTIMRYIAADKMHFVKIGNKWKISQENLTAYMTGRPQK